MKGEALIFIHFLKIYTKLPFPGAVSQRRWSWHLIFSSSNRYLSSTIGGLGLSDGQRNLVSVRGGGRTVWEERTANQTEDILLTIQFKSLILQIWKLHLFLGTNPGLYVSFLNSQFSIKKPKSPLCFLSDLFGKADLCFQLLLYSYTSQFDCLKTREECQQLCRLFTTWASHGPLRACQPQLV